MYPLKSYIFINIYTHVSTAKVKNISITPKTLLCPFPVNSLHHRPQTSTALISVTLAGFDIFSSFRLKKKIIRNVLFGKYAFIYSVCHGTHQHHRVY